jgi:hypothetical protein
MENGWGFWISASAVVLPVELNCIGGIKGAQDGSLTESVCVQQPRLSCIYPSRGRMVNGNIEMYN